MIHDHRRAPGHEVARTTICEPELPVFLKSVFVQTTGGLRGVTEQLHVLNSMPREWPLDRAQGINSEVASSSARQSGSFLPSSLDLSHRFHHHICYLQQTTECAFDFLEHLCTRTLSSRSVADRLLFPHAAGAKLASFEPATSRLLSSLSSRSYHQFRRRLATKYLVQS
jgi:hypothetical protein